MNNSPIILRNRWLISGFVSKDTQAIRSSEIFLFRVTSSRVARVAAIIGRRMHVGRFNSFALILSGNKSFNRIATPDINYGAAEEARVDGREKKRDGRCTFFGGARALFHSIVS